MGEISYDYAKIAANKDAVVAKLRGGIGALEAAHGVEVINGFGKLTSANTIDVDGTVIEADKIILATGSAPARPPIPGIEGKNVVTSDEVLAMTELPESFVIIGGGVIGMEFTTLFASLGKKGYGSRDDALYPAGRRCGHRKLYQSQPQEKRCHHHQ